MDVPWKPITTVDELVASFENSVFDFKTIYDLEKEHVRFDIASDVAAFANAFGGSIIVGIHEKEGRAIAIPGIAHVSRLLDAIAIALQQHCVPVAATPVEHALTVTPQLAARILASGATAPSSPITVVALNVQPDSRGPIGVRGSPRGQSRQDFYKFLRIDDQTRFLDPTELPMWMNTHERRIAVRIRAIPAKSAVRVFEEGDESTVNLVAVNESQAVATFSKAGEFPRRDAPAFQSFSRNHGAKSSAPTAGVPIGTPAVGNGFSPRSARSGASLDRTSSSRRIRRA